MDVLRVEAARIKHPILKPVKINPQKGLTPAAVADLAVLVNPKLVAERDREGIAKAQLLEAGILPNPRLTSSLAFPVAGALAGTLAGYSYGLTYDIRSLITRNANIQAAKAHARSVDLDVAWQEWLVAEAAKTDAYDVLLLEKKLALARKEEKAREASLTVIRKAVRAGNMTITRLVAALSSLARTHLEVLGTRQALEQDRLALDREIGFPPGRHVRLSKNTSLPAIATVPPAARLLKDLQKRRIDLIALKIGYRSQEERVRAAILSQFPDIIIGAEHARDTQDIITTGLTGAIAIPLFNRNQGNIAIQRATRKRLFAEYVDRLFRARSQIIAARQNLGSLQGRITAARKAVLALERLIRTYHTTMLEGNVNVITYYNVLDRLTARRLAVLDLEFKLVDQFVALEIASGRVFYEGGGKRIG